MQASCAMCLFHHNLAALLYALTSTNADDLVDLRHEHGMLLTFPALSSHTGLSYSNLNISLSKSKRSSSACNILFHFNTLDRTHFNNRLLSSMVVSIHFLCPYFILVDKAVAPRLCYWGFEAGEQYVVLHGVFSWQLTIEGRARLGGPCRHLPAVLNFRSKS